MTSKTAEEAAAVLETGRNLIIVEMPCPQYIPTLLAKWA